MIPDVLFDIYVPLRKFSLAFKAFLCQIAQTCSFTSTASRACYKSDGDTLGAQGTWFNFLRE